MIKTILLTFSATLTAAVAAGSIFINSILGVFGLATTSLEAMQDLQKSQAIVQAMKQRNKTRSSKVTKRFMKRTSRRLAGSAAAAATIGTAAVVTTVAILEVMDYCEEKAEMLEEENLLFGTEKTFDYEACKDEATEDVKQIAASTKDEVSASVRESWDNTGNYTREKWNEAIEASGSLFDRLKSRTSEWWGSLLDWEWN